jgi:lysophospholipase L1-like esterase
MKKLLLISSAFIFSFGINNAIAQSTNPPFYNDIQNFKKQDSINPPPQHAVLFVGSSSFTKWTDVQNYFPNIKIINRGFGGSILPDVIRYANDIIFPYHPKQVVIYCGDNDLAASDTVTAEIVVARAKQLFQMIRNKLPDANIAYVSIKPSPSRARLLTKDEAANDAIKSYLATQKNTAFIDVYHAMLTGSGQPISEIFLSDSLHMNAKGYQIWQKIINPVLLK